MTKMTDSPRGLLYLPLLDALGLRRRIVGVALGIAIIVVIAMAQPSVYAELPIATMYLVPVVIIAWIGGPWAGAFGALVAAAARYGVDVGSGRVFSHPNVPLLNLVISALLYVVIAVLLARLHRTLVYERELARTDPLTLLGNRRFFEHVAGVELSRSRRYGRPFALAYLDVDHFKEVNDRHGHAAGDALLRRISALLVECLRTSDVVARLGGDEFAMLLPETPPDGAVIAMAKMHETLTAAVGAIYPDVSFSIGVVTYQSGGGSLADVLDAADRSMYIVKNGGRGNVHVSEYGQERERVPAT